MDMVNARNLTSHTYNVELAEGVARDIVENFYPALVALEATLNQPLARNEDSEH